jgi:2-keto-3-deoxy-L-rhamnonate aldolase RhmA
MTAAHLRLARPAPGSSHVGTFVKTASVQVIEILAMSRLDFVVVDAEHAPFDRRDIDLMVLAGRACGLPVAVRVPDSEAATLLSALDLGAAGLVVPHVDTAEQARALVARVRFRGGLRGFSSSPRAAGYGSLQHEAGAGPGRRRHAAVPDRKRPGGGGTPRRSPRSTGWTRCS